ncbi:P-loop containing nucleoside triphosphate hydrolase protein [Xylariaceae sp. FL0594]|nr:P-loop containing nucleoside triphosphate hydrolase protein [Xylariaceae sp. FL0594]
MIQRFFKQWLKVDLTTLAVALTLLSALKTGYQFARNLGNQLWGYVTRFFVSSIYVLSSDRLNQEIAFWVTENVLPKRHYRSLASATSGHQFSELSVKERSYEDSIRYTPQHDRCWFIHDHNVFFVRPGSSSPLGLNQSYESGGLEVMCLGRSTEPIKRFFKAVRQYTEDRTDTNVHVYVPGHDYRYKWEFSRSQPKRALKSIHLGQNVKNDLLADIEEYMSPQSLEFYRSVDIPYRRGYLLHRPPGTGKTSTCTALAGHFNMSLYVMHLPTVSSDTALGELFGRLPKRCFIVMEDVDAVGGATEDRGGRREEIMRGGRTSSVTLAGLLNVLDGITSGEGRIVLMTTNYRDHLDSALIRPGRIDKIIHMGKMERPMAEDMFTRIYKTYFKHNRPAEDSDAYDEDTVPPALEKLASEFAAGFPEDTVTPAQLQGYLVDHRRSPKAAIAGLQAWAAGVAAEEKARAERLEAMLKEAELEDSKRRGES